SFVYQVCDPDGACDNATFSLKVTPVNDPPELSARDFVTNEDEPIRQQFDVADPDSTNVEVRLLTLPRSGSVDNLDPASGTYRYVPAPGYSGPDRFTIEACDREGSCVRKIVNVLVRPINDPPVTADISTNATSGIAVSLNLPAEDPEGAPVLYRLTSSPQHGDLIEFDPSTGGLTYRPDDDYTGPETISFEACDPEGACASAQVTVFVFSAGGGAESVCDGIIISEIAWSGTEASPEHEWIELRNIGTQPVDLRGWTLRWRPTDEPASWSAIPLQGVPLEARSDPLLQRTELNPYTVWVSFALSQPTFADHGIFERRSDEAVHGITAQVVYADASSDPDLLRLPDTGAVVELISPSGCLVDRVDPADDPLQPTGRRWIAGQAKPPATMERSIASAEAPSTDWHTHAGLFSAGEDAEGAPLRATAGAANAPSLAALAAVHPTETVNVPSATPLHLSLGMRISSLWRTEVSGFAVPRTETGSPGANLVLPVSITFIDDRATVPVDAVELTDASASVAEGGEPPTVSLLIDGLELPSGEWDLWLPISATEAVCLAIRTGS
ncbi:hypothetical protein JW848_05760, partial [Candidatus Bipolaricaulota bacterium]|nr:hypothetical protein [Candidatus Bipolaricaulota bacterium]